MNPSNAEQRIQSLAHEAITNAEAKINSLEGKFAGATTDHLAVHKSLLQELKDDIAEAKQWLLHLFPHLGEQPQQEQQGTPATAEQAVAAVAAQPAPVTVTQVAGDAQPGGEAVSMKPTTDTNTAQGDASQPTTNGPADTTQA